MAWHTIKDAAPLIGLSVSNVYRLIETRRLTHRRVGLRKGSGRIEISDEAIAAFLKSCEVSAIEPAASSSVSPASRRPEKSPRRGPASATKIDTSAYFS